MQDGARIPNAGLLRGRLFAPEEGTPHTSEIELGLGPHRSNSFERPRVSTPGRLCCLWVAGHRAWRRPCTCRGLGRRPPWGPSKWLCLRSPAPFASAVAFARGLLLRHMGRAGMAGRYGLPYKPGA